MLSLVPKILVCAFGVVGCAALILAGMLALPLRRPPPLASIHAGALKIDQSGLPELTRFQARDGTWLAYRLYPAGGEQVAILAHGSTASSEEMNPLAKALAAAGVSAVALDVRGHGASGGRGDIGYIGQLENDLSDLLDHLGRSYPAARFSLIGHSLGGGFVARVSGTPVGRRFERFVLLAPFLGAQAPTNRPENGGWAVVDMPRILALTVLRNLGAPFGQSLPVIAYANDPSAAMHVTSVYSYRLLFDYSPDYDWGRTKATIVSAASKTRLIAGADDELMDAPAYVREIKPLGVETTILPGVDHIGVVYQPAALSATVAAVKEP
jgi:pimeloyl-ACP methyl ester carboxylesterase